MTTRSTDQRPRSQSAWHLAVAILLTAALAISWFLGFGPGGTKCAPASVATSAPAATSVATAPPASSSPSSPAAPQVTAEPPVEVASAPVQATATAPTTAPTPDTAPASAPPAAAPEAAASTTAAPEITRPSTGKASPVRVAKLYFASEKANLPRDAGRSLAEIVKYLKANPSAKALVSGFHDPSGNPASNARLAQRRAQAVAAALEKAGIDKERIVLQKPVQTAGTGRSSEARRVEVAIQ